MIGNAHIRQRLDESLAQGSPAPAYLFLGPKGVGKAMVARWLAQRLLCKAPGPPCGRCAACQRVESGNHPDLLVMERVPGKASLGIDDVRERISEVQLRPYEGGYRFWILTEAERLTDEAQSALLKTLEEPPPHLVLVLVAGGEDSLLPTVTSRCRIQRFGPVDPVEIEGLLRERGVEPDRAAVAARICGGSPGVALGLAEAKALWEVREAALDVASGLAGGDTWKAMEAAAELEALKTDTSDPKADLERVLEALTTWYRDALCLAVGSDDRLVVNVHRLEALRSLAGRSDARKLDSALHRILEAGDQVRRNVQPKLLLQRMCLELTRV